jgi:hypothetical protein
MKLHLLILTIALLGIVALASPICENSTAFLPLPTNVTIHDTDKGCGNIEPWCTHPNHGVKRRPGLDGPQVLGLLMAIAAAFTMLG